MNPVILVMSLAPSAVVKPGYTTKEKVLLQEAAREWLTSHARTVSRDDPQWVHMQRLVRGEVPVSIEIKPVF